MKIKVMNKTDAREYIPEGKAIIIRMGDTIYFSKLKGEYIAEKEFYFSDIEDSSSSYAIKEKHAEDIINFVKENLTEDLEEIVVHCHYAQGRSPSVAASLAHNMFNIPFDVSKYPDINKLVYNRVKEKLDELRNPSRFF